MKEPESHKMNVAHDIVVAVREHIIFEAAAKLPIAGLSKLQKISEELSSIVQGKIRYIGGEAEIQGPATTEKQSIHQ